MIGHFEDGAKIATISCRTRLKENFFSTGETKKNTKKQKNSGPPRDEKKKFSARFCHILG